MLNATNKQLKATAFSDRTWVVIIGSVFSEQVSCLSFYKNVMKVAALAVKLKCGYKL